MTTTIPEIKLGDGVKMISTLPSSSNTEANIGNFNYSNAYNFYPESVTNGKCGEEFKGFCSVNRYCSEWGDCKDKQTARREDHKRNEV